MPVPTHSARSVLRLNAPRAASKKEANCFAASGAVSVRVDNSKSHVVCELSMDVLRFSRKKLLILLSIIIVIESNKASAIFLASTQATKLQRQPVLPVSPS